MSQSLDAIVVGLGAMGGAALSSLAARGLDVVGVEQYAIPHDVGSSHGRTRVIRTAYFEHPAYVPLLVEAFERWRALEASAGEPLLAMTGAIHIGPADHEGIAGVLAAADQHQLECERLTGREIEDRFPALRPGSSDVGVFEADAGVLSVERCVVAQVDEARRRGARVRPNEAVTGIEPERDRVVVHVGGGVLSCDTLVLCTGAWMSGSSLVEPPCELRVERQVQLWFDPRQPEIVAPDNLPVFVHFFEDRAYYGLPRTGESGIKICRHYGGELTSPDAIDRRLRDEDEADVRAYARAHIPSADGPLLDARVCMYTNTPDKHFCIGRHPQHPRVVVAGGFSGHGFKLAPVIGEIVADVVVDGRSDRDIELFSPRRFEK